MGLEAKWSLYKKDLTKNASDLVLCLILSFFTKILTLRFSLNFEMFIKAKSISGSSILHNFSILSLWKQNLIGIWGILVFFDLVEPRIFVKIKFFYVYMSDYLVKLLVLMDTLYSSISCENSFPLVCLYYSKYCNTSQATSMEKPEKEDEIDLELRWILAAELKWTSLKAQCLRAPPYAACHEALWRKLQV